MNYKLLLIALFMIFVSASGCTDSTENSTLSENNYTKIYIDDYTFHPESLTVEKGTTVQWINNDSVAFVIKSFAFQSPTLRKNSTFAYTFNKTGTYNIYFITHPYVRSGIVVVK